MLIQKILDIVVNLNDIEARIGLGMGHDFHWWINNYKVSCSLQWKVGRHSLPEFTLGRSEMFIQKIANVEITSKTCILSTMGTLKCATDSKVPFSLSVLYIGQLINTYLH